jgi:hydrogenase/urease accessory protein HupE
VVRSPDRFDSRLNYELEYPLSGGPPERLAVEQDVLNEFDFAPGNPWEATYVVRAGLFGRPAMEGVLLRSHEPLRLDLRRLASLDAAAAGVDRLRLTREYVRHGIVHILSGYDHLLFITALVLAVATLWDLVKVISVFTLAHSITLTLAVLNLVRLPEHIVEPVIAASIVVVALQNIVAPARSRGPGRLCLAFVFGLFHGLGFAGGLLSAMEGMAGVAVGLAIVAFSAGVEIGHQLIVVPVFCALKVMRKAQGPAATRTHVLRYGSAGIFVIGVVYLAAALR